MKRIGLAVIVLSTQGVSLGQKVADFLRDREVAVFAPAKLGTGRPYRSLKGLVAGLFPQVGGLVFVCAVGVAVRLVAPHLRDKFCDPPVVVLDEAGRFAVSLTGGHHGANSLTEEIAAAVGARPVVTTASDVRGRPAVDLFAGRFNLGLDPREHLPAVARALVEGERVALLWEEGLPLVEYGWPPEVDIFPWQPEASFPQGFAAWITVTEKLVKRLPPAPFVLLRPRRYVVGVGCRRGTAKAEILSALMQVIQGAGLSLLSVRELATAALKENEEGLKQAAAALGVPLRLFSTDALRERRKGLRPGTVRESLFVREKIGVGNVCELAALTAGGEKVVVPKTVFPGVTVAVAAAPWP